jgi:hypothetical protein
MSSNGHGKRENDELVVAALATGATYAEAAASSGVSKSTVRRRMAEPDFRARVYEERRELVDSMRARLLQAAPSAIESLASLAVSAESDAVRVRAAREIVDLALGRKRNFDAVSSREFVWIVGRMIEAALRRVPEEHQESFITEIQALAESA